MEVTVSMESLNANAEEMQRLRDERDEVARKLNDGRDKYRSMVEQCQEFDIQVGVISGRLRESEEREQALAAHVERIIEWWVDETKTKLDLGEFAAIISDQPATSLARRDAGKKAEALAEASALRRYAMRLHDSHDWRDHLLVEANRIEQQVMDLRQQAEGSQQ